MVMSESKERWRWKVNFVCICRELLHCHYYDSNQRIEERDNA